jgi:long-chain acyl-CoA synthetase
VFGANANWHRPLQAMTPDALQRRLAEAPDQRLRLISASGVEEVRSFAELLADARLLQSELASCGVSAGDLVGILGPNSYAWIVADIALVMLGCVSVAPPLERAGGPVDAEAILDRYALSALLISESVITRRPLSRHMALLEGRPVSLLRRVNTEGPKLPPDVFTVAFSSGTAGTQKGLMISRKGIYHTVATSAAGWQVTDQDEILITMPFSHFQQRYLLYLAITCGAGASIVPPERAFREMRNLSPSIVVGPPSFFEILDNRIRAASRLKRISYDAARILHRIVPRHSKRLRHRLGKKWLDIYGSSARLLLVGSAPVSPRLLTVFNCLDGPLYEVYGMTEVGWIAFNLPGRHCIDSVGVPVDGVHVTVDAEGVIYVDSPAPQALGYIFDGLETEDSVFLGDGRIATGDLGHLDDSGFLHLVGRSKNMLITRSGVKVNPETLEREIMLASPDTTAMVAGSASATTLSCVIWLEDDENPGRQRHVREVIDRLNAGQEASHQIARVIFQPVQKLTVESGLLTRSLKINRDAVTRELLGDR